MATDSNTAVSSGWSFQYIILWAGVPFILGVALGVAAHRLLPQKQAINAASAPRPMDAPAARPATSSEQLKSLADKEAEPLLAELKSKPDDPVLLAKVGNIYYVTRDFKKACMYFQRSVDIKDNPTLRTELGRAYFYAGNPDEALAQFEKVLKVEPSNANALFNFGMVKWQSKFDVDGAVAAWEQILKEHPDHPRRTEVEQLIARAKQHRDLKKLPQSVPPAN